MLMTATDLSSFVLRAGEPFFLEVQFQDNTGAVIDLTDKAHVLSFYREDRSTVEAIDGEQLIDATGRFLRFARDGRLSESLYGQNLLVELTERYLHGREVVASGRLTVERSAAGVPSYDTIVTKFVTRITIKDNMVLGGPPTFTQQRLLYRPDIVPPKVTLGALSTSGTLRVGTASNGTIVGATAGSTIVESVGGFAIDPAALTYTYDGSGPAGTVTNALIETHPNATNSPRSSALTLAAAPITLTALSLAASSVTENAAPGVVVGGILGKTAGSTLSLMDDDGGRFAISGTNLVAGLTAIDYEAAPSRSIVLRETLAGATNSSRDTALAVGVINVFEQPSLRALLLSSTSLTVGTAANGAISEAATGSTITASGLPAGFAINGPARTWSYDGSGPASSSTVTLTETLGDSPNSPRSTQIGVTVSASAAFTMQQLATPNRIYQRDIVAGVPQMVGTVPVMMTVTTSGTIYARTRAVSAGNAVLSPPRKVLDNVATGSRAVAITGVPAIVEEFYLDLSADGVTWQNGTVPIGMGKLIGYAGQSLMEAMLGRRDSAETMASVGETPTTAGRICSEGGAWQAIVDAASGVNSAGFNALIRLQSAAAGCRIGMVGYAQGATEIAFWVPGGAGWNKFKAAIDATGNRIESMLWLQGHSDTASSGFNTGYYRKQLSALFTALDGIALDTSFIRYVATIPNISVTNWGRVSAKEAVRVAGERWCRENARAVSIIMDDLKLADGVHQSQGGAVQTAVHFHRYMLNPATAVGATVGAVTKAGAAFTVPLTLSAGATSASITGDLSTRMLAFPRGLRDPAQALAISSVALGATAGGVAPLTVTLSADPGDIDVDIVIYPKNDPSSDGSLVVLRDNLVGDGSPAGRLITWARPARYAQARALTLKTGPAFSAGRWSGRQGLSAGAAAPGRVYGNWAEGWTMEAWIFQTGASGTNVFLHAGGAYFAVGGDDLNLNGGGVAGVLPRNVWNHVAVTSDAGCLLGHANGVQVGGGAPGSDFPPSQLPGIRGFDDGGFRPAAGALTISDVAVWSQPRYGSEPFSVPTAPYAGNEPFLDHLWTLNGNGLDSRIR